MSIALTPRGHFEAPTAPWEIREAVELYAREHGRTGSIEFVPERPVRVGDRTVMAGPNCWIVKLSLRCDDKAMLLYQQGLAPEPPVESVPLLEANPTPGGQPYRALDIYQMGAAGVREFLERGNSWSGRGEHGSIAEATKKARENDQDRREKEKESVRDDVKARARENRVWYAKRAFERIARQVVGVDLRPNREA